MKQQRLILSTVHLQKDTLICVSTLMYIISIDNCSTQWEPARLGPAASTCTGPADGQRIGVNACHSWGENLVLKTSVMFGMHVGTLD